MTTANSVSRLVVPTHSGSAAERIRQDPKPKRIRVGTRDRSTSPSAVVMAELRVLLAELHPDKQIGKYRWMHVLIVIHYETAGHPEGFALADQWSKQGEAFVDAAKVSKYWNAIKPPTGSPLTIRTLRWMVEQIAAEKNGDSKP